MAVRLATLKATADLDPSKYVAAARQVDDANKKMTAGQQTVGVAMQQTEARASQSARSFDRYRASLDPVFASQRGVERGAAMINAALARGQIDTAKAAELTASLERRYAVLRATLGGLPEVFTRLGASVATVNAQFDQHRRGLDPLYASQRRLVEGQTMWRDALARGAITQAEYTRGLQLLNREAVATSAGLGGMAASMARFAAVAAGFAAIGVARSVFDTALAFERVDSALLAATGSSTKAAAEFEFVRAQADRLGLDLQSTALDYARLAAAAKGTAFEGEAARNIFLAVAEAATVLKLPAETASGALNAMQQIISKGTVSMEELRAQLGDRLPGALQIAARAMGITTGELVEMVSSGKLAAEEFLPKFAKEMRDTFGSAVPTAANSAQAAVNRFQNAYKEMLLDVAKSGALDTAVEAMNALRDVMRDPQLKQGLSDVGAGIRLIGDALKYAGGWAKDLRDMLPTIGGVNPADVVGGGPGAMLRLYNSRQGILESVTPAPPQYSRRPTDLFDRGYSVAPNASYRPIPVTAPARPASGGGSGGGGGGKSDAQRAREDAEERQDALNKYIKGLETELKLVKLTALEREKEEAILEATRLIQDDRVKGEEQLSAEVKKQITDRVEMLNLERERQEVSRQRDEEAKQAAEDQRRRVEEFNDEVLQEAADTIAGLWKGGKDGLEDTLQYWKQRILQWLSEMAAKLILQPIIAPILQSAGIGAGALGSSTGGIGANFGSQGVGGVTSIGSALGSLGGSIDKLGMQLGLQGSTARTPDMLKLDAQGLFGTETFLSDVLGGALGGIGLGGTTAALTGGNSLGGSIGGLVGGALGSFLGPIGSMVGGIVGGFLGGLIGPKPTNATARVDFDEYYTRTQVPFSKETAETRSAINNAADQIVGVVQALESVGTTFNDRLTAIALGTRDPSYIQFESGKLLRSAVGDPNALALTAIKELVRTASFESESLGIVAKRDFSSLEDLTSALDFVRNTYDVITGARPALTATEQAMKDLGEGLKAARREAEKLGLSVDKLDIGARNLFNRDINDQIRAITDPVGLALEEFERGAIARVEMAKKLGADLVNVERLNALQREQVLKQAQEQSFAGLKSLIDDLDFGNLSLGVPQSDQYFSALTAYNTAKRSALDLRTPEAIGDFESYSRSLIPIAQQFLGVSTNFADLRSDILSTARTLGTPTTDPSTAAIVTATTQGTAQIVDAVQQHDGTTRELRDEVKRMNAFIQALMNKLGNAA